jgi:hypothetical protein
LKKELKAAEVAAGKTEEEAGPVSHTKVTVASEESDEDSDSSSGEESEEDGQE